MDRSARRRRALLLALAAASVTLGAYLAALPFRSQRRAHVLESHAQRVLLSLIASAPRASPATPATELHVPHASGPIAVDGELDDAPWIAGPARTYAFVDGTGGEVHPYSDARLTWGDGQLYLALYAADEDIRAMHDVPDGPLWLDDAFHVVLGTPGAKVAARVLEVSPTGVLTDGAMTAPGTVDYSWQSGARVGHVIEETLNDPSDDDEEWVIELAIPLSALGVKEVAGERLTFSARRCDTPKRARRVCGSFGERSPVVLVLDR